MSPENTGEHSAADLVAAMPRCVTALPASGQSLHRPARLGLRPGWQSQRLSEQKLMRASLSYSWSQTSGSTRPPGDTAMIRVDCAGGTRSGKSLSNTMSCDSVNEP